MAKEMTCICQNVKNKANFMEVINKDKIYTYHKRCPEHGMELLAEYPLVPFRAQRWFTLTQLRMGGRHWIEPKLIETTPDKQRGLVEITLYRVMTDEEKAEYDKGFFDENSLT